MSDSLVVFSLLVGAGFLVLGVAGLLEKASRTVRRRRHSPTAGVTRLATSPHRHPTSSDRQTLADLERFEESIDPAMAERRRRAFELVQAKVIAEAKAAHRWGRDSSGKRYGTIREFLADLASHESRRRDW